MNDINEFERELNYALKKIQECSVKLRKEVALPIETNGGLPSLPNLAKFICKKNDWPWLIKYIGCVEKKYVDLCEILEGKSLPIKLPCWICKDLLSFLEYNGTNKNFVEEMVCGLTSFCAFAAFINQFDSFCRECSETFFVNRDKLFRILDECLRIGDELWVYHKEKFFEYLVLAGVSVVLEKGCIDGLDVYSKSRIVVDYILEEFKNCCEKYAEWKVYIAIDEKRN